MGAETAVLSSLAALAATGSQIDRQRDEAKRQRQIQQQQLQDKKRTLEARRRQAAGRLRARYGASGFTPKSRSLEALLHGINSHNDADLQSLHNLHRLRTPQNPNASGAAANGIAALLRGVQNRGS